MDYLANLGDTFFNWKVIGEVLPSLFTVGLPNTLVLALSSGIIGTVLGMLLALMGIARNPVARWIARVYTAVFRGLPAILTILAIGLGFGPIVRELTGITSPYPMGVAALSLISAAYIGEILRSGSQSVEKVQLEAARALGEGHVVDGAGLDAGERAGLGLGFPGHVRVLVAQAMLKTMVFFSVNASRASVDSSRPRPLALAPPNGASWSQ